MAARDRWSGWDDRTRARNLRRVVNNSRFPLLPWVGVRNLAGAVLARGLSQLVKDWRSTTTSSPGSGRRRWIRSATTVVATAPPTGSRWARPAVEAAWIVTGRRRGEAPKTVPVYPAVRNAKQRLRKSCAMPAAHCPAPPDLSPHAAAEAAFAETKAHLMFARSPPDERERRRTRVSPAGPGVDAQAPARASRSTQPGEAVGPVERADDVECSQRRVHQRHMETTFGTVTGKRGGRR